MSRTSGAFLFNLGKFFKATLFNHSPEDSACGARSFSFTSLAGTSSLAETFFDLSGTAFADEDFAFGAKDLRSFEGSPNITKATRSAAAIPPATVRGFGSFLWPAEGSAGRI